MNAQSPIDSTIRLVHLDKLYLHDMNPRQNGSDADTAAMAQSIAINGLMQNLMGYEDPEGDGEIGIVAGGRRLHALQHLKSEGSGLMDSKEPDWDAIPVQVTDDPMLARSWAGAESTTQRPLHPADEIRAYAAMADQGSDPDTIARAFAQTIRHVKGRLALACLIPEALDALRAGHISLDLAKALTLARDEADQLSVLTGARSGNWNAHRVRDALTKETIRGDNRKVLFVGLEEYQSNGGTMDADLFEDQSYLHDKAVVDQLFKVKLETEAEALRVEQGWSWMITSTEAYASHNMLKGLTPIYRTEVELPEADQIEYEDLSERRFDQRNSLNEEAQQRLEELQTRADGDFTDEDRETGGIIVVVNHKGDLKTEGAYTRKGATTNKDDIVEHKPAAAKPAAAKPALTQAGAEDLRRISLMALQGAMIDKTEFLLELFAWQMERGAPSYSSPFAISLTDQPITPEAEGSWHIDARLNDPDHSVHNFSEDTAATFKAFQAKGKKHRNQVISRGLTRALQIPSGQMAALGAVMSEFAGVDIRKAWTPDAPTYFSRLNTPAMETLWAELLEADVDDERVAAFGQLKKGQKAKELSDLFANAEVQETLGLTRDQISRIDAWLPSELQAND